MIDVGDLVGLIFAIAFALLALAMVWLLLRLRKTVDELTRLVEGITDKTVPLLGEVRRVLRDKISSHAIEMEHGPGLHLGARDARDSV